MKRHWERRREERRVRPRDLALIESGVVSERMRPFLELADREYRELLDAKGGIEAVSPQVAALIRDTAKVGAVLNGLLARYAETEDPEVASRIGTLASARRASLVAVGLERTTPELNLRDYLAARDSAPGSDCAGAEERSSWPAHSSAAE